MADDIRGDKTFDSRDVDDRIDELREALGLDRLTEIGEEIAELEEELEGMDQTAPENEERVAEITDETLALEAERADLEKAAEEVDEDEREELRQLEAFKASVENYCEWDSGATFIRDSHFSEYAEELANDIGAVNSEAGWPVNCIDWDKAAEQLKIDYTSETLDGVEYWVR